MRTTVAEMCGEDSSWCRFLADGACTGTPHRSETPMTDEEALYLTIDEVATLLHVPKDTLYWWRRTHEGPPALKLPNGRLLYRRDQVLAWTDRQRAMAA